MEILKKKQNFSLISLKLSLDLLVNRPNMVITGVRSRWDIKMRFLAKGPPSLSPAFIFLGHFRAILSSLVCWNQNPMYTLLLVYAKNTGSWSVKKRIG